MRHSFDTLHPNGSLENRSRATARLGPVPGYQPYRPANPPGRGPQLRALRSPVRRRRVLRQPLFSSTPPPGKQERENAPAALDSIAYGPAVHGLGHLVFQVGRTVSGGRHKARTDPSEVDAEGQLPGVDGEIVGRMLRAGGGVIAVRPFKASWAPA